jgi:SAM-dependent methyltransferase
MSAKNLFDLSEHYDEMLQKGIRLSGEDRQFFSRGRLRDLASRLPAGSSPRRVLDFGCGLGDTSAELADMFPAADVLGVDTSGPAIEHARAHHMAGRRLSFETLDRLAADGSFDLAYCNGVFHHIPLAERDGAAALVFRSLAPGGRFALFENNPLNPGTRMVMSRIPFDHDAVTLTPWKTVGLLKKAGFQIAARPRSLFYFPRPLAVLRLLEPWLANLPLGAQYWVMGQKPLPPAARVSP